MDNTIHSLVDQHLKEYDMRLRHLDDILWKAQKRLIESRKAAEEASAEFSKLKQERDRLASWVREIKQRPAETLQEDETVKAGPMDVWDAVAQQGEKLMESIERRQIARHA